jgi:enoyl-[acyl-carrier protein] reductase III
MKKKVALVTGSSRGIGRAIALELAKNNTDMVITYRRNGSRSLAEEVTHRVRAFGNRALLVKADVTNRDSVSGLFERIQAEFGHLDILVNNAASAVFRPLLQLEPKHWEHVWDINVRALNDCIRNAVTLMKGRKASIVNVTSLGSIKYLPNYGALGAAKAAIESLTRSYAVELAPEINVNAVCGSLVEQTGISDWVPDSEKKNWAQMTPAGRNLQPEDIAGIVAFLCSDKAEMIRGQAIVVDGGLTIKV